MRFKLIYTIASSGNNTIPLNYQYEFSSWIYRTIHYADPGFARWLHDEGYTAGRQHFKFFTFSNLEIPRRAFSIAGDRMRILSDECSMQISFLIGEAASPFIRGLFLNQDFTIGDKISQVRFRVKSVERMPDPLFGNEMTFRALSPVVIGKSRAPEGGSGKAYLSPEADGYGPLFIQNLASKVLVSKTRDKISPAELEACRFELLGKPKKKGILIKAHTPEQTKVIGYQFRFRITAPADWLAVGYDAGFGEENSEGMGCAGIDDNERREK